MDMKPDVEELLRDGMGRFTEGVRAPAGLAAAVSQRHRRRVAVRVSAACGGVAAIAAAAAIAAVGLPGGGPATTQSAGAQARTVTYLVSRVKQALADEHRVFYGRTNGTDGPSVTWVYGPRIRWEELTGTSCGHTLPNGDCAHQDGSERFLAQGTARIGGKLTGVYVTYYNRKWSLSPEIVPANACSTTARMEMSGVPVPTSHWSSFIDATLACGTASVTGHVWIDGQETTKITGAPVTERLQPGEAKALGEKWTRGEWTLYVNPKTYLPVRIVSATSTFGGPRASEKGVLVTDVQWLKPTAANIAKAMVTIPPGFRQVASPASQ
jgi:hypothetical protein